MFNHYVDLPVRVIIQRLGAMQKKIVKWTRGAYWTISFVQIKDAGIDKIDIQ
jgi:hypothetical protein